MESEFSYSSNTNSLALVVDPPPKIDLPFEILFSVNSLVHDACFPATSLDTEFYLFLDPKTHDRAHSLIMLFKSYCALENVRMLMLLGSPKSTQNGRRKKSLCNRL